MQPPGRPAIAHRLRSVVMPMMNVRIVPVSMLDRLVHVSVRMGLPAIPVGIVLMPVVGVMDV